MLTSYLERYEAIRASNAGLKAYFVTFTVKNGDDLGERFRHLRNKLQAYHKRRMGKGQIGEVCKAEGAVWTYEFTNRGKGWHPHAHCIWLCKTKPDVRKIKTEWEALTGDSFMVDCREITDPLEGFIEVFKYAIKFGDLELADNFHAYTLLSGERLIASFGLFRGVVVPEALTDEPLDDLPFFDLLYRYVKGAGYTLEK